MRYHLFSVPVYSESPQDCVAKIKKAGAARSTNWVTDRVVGFIRVELQACELKIYILRHRAKRFTFNARLAYGHVDAAGFASGSAESSVLLVKESATSIRRRLLDSIKQDALAYFPNRWIDWASVELLCRHIDWASLRKR